MFMIFQSISYFVVVFSCDLPRSETAVVWLFGQHHIKLFRVFANNTTPNAVVAAADAASANK